MRSARPAPSLAAEKLEAASAAPVARAAPVSARSPASVLALQRTAGNAAVVAPPGRRGDGTGPGALPLCRRLHLRRLVRLRGPARGGGRCAAGPRGRGAADAPADGRLPE